MSEHTIGVAHAIDSSSVIPNDAFVVGHAYTEQFAPLPRDWPARLVGVADRVALGTDFPNIPYAYAEQLAAIASWAAADDRLGAPFLRSVLHDVPARLLGVDDGTAG